MIWIGRPQAGAVFRGDLHPKRLEVALHLVLGLEGGEEGAGELAGLLLLQVARDLGPHHVEGALHLRAVFLVEGGDLLLGGGHDLGLDLLLQQLLFVQAAGGELGVDETVDDEAVDGTLARLVQLHPRLEQLPGSLALQLGAGDGLTSDGGDHVRHRIGTGCQVGRVGVGCGGRLRAGARQHQGEGESRRSHTGTSRVGEALSRATPWPPSADST